MKSIISRLPAQTDLIESNIKPDDLGIKQEMFPSRYYDKFIRPGNLLMLPEAFQATAVKRFIILVPAESFPTSNLSFNIGRYTLPGMSLLFLAMVTDPDQELTIHRQLAFLVNTARSPILQVGSRLVTNGTWIEAVKEVWREGDLIICLEDHKVRQYLVQSIGLGRKIFATLHVPILILQDIHILSQSSFQNAVREVVSWLLFILTILFFTLLQIQIDQANTGWQGNVLLCLTLIMEYYVIWKINAFFN